MLAERDVVFVTLDSCRYDTAAAARTPNLYRLGPLLRAETSGTYTLPAHTAFFSGNLPRPFDGRYPVGGRELEAIWRSAAARSTSRSIGMVFDGRTVIDHYRRLGYRVIGAGGVTFFDPDEPNNWMPDLFDEFHYYGRRNRTAAASRIVDRCEILTLAHVDEIAGRCLTAERFFLFINCPSTHVPYTTPAARLTGRLEGVLSRLYELHDSKRNDARALTPDDVGLLLEMQLAALEWADRRLGRLFDALLARRPLVIVCADHGEEFGDHGRYGHGHADTTVTTVPMWCGLLDGEQLNAA